MPRLPGNMAVVAALLAAAGCATVPPEPPRVPLSEATEAISRAEQQEAAEFASLEMQMATDKLEQARTIVATDSEPQFDRARRLAEQAQLDARVAEARAAATRLQELRDQLAQTVELLRYRDESAGEAP